MFAMILVSDRDGGYAASMEQLDQTALAMAKSIRSTVEQSDGPSEFGNVSGPEFAHFNLPEVLEGMLVDYCNNLIDLFDNTLDGEDVVVFFGDTEQEAKLAYHDYCDNMIEQLDGFGMDD